MCLWSHVSAVTQLTALTVTITYALIQMVKKIVRSSSSSLLLCVGVCCGLWCVVVCGVVVCGSWWCGVHGILCVCVCLYICGCMNIGIYICGECLCV